MYVFALIFLFLGCQTRSYHSAPVAVDVVVREGDTPRSLSEKYDTSWRRIAMENNLRSGEPLKVGQMLKVRPGPLGIPAGMTSSKGKEGMRAQSHSLEEPADAQEFKEEDFPPPDTDSTSLSKKKKRTLFPSKDSKNFQSNLTWPTKGPMISKFGYRGSKFHRGVDIKAPTGSPVVAAYSGRVLYTGKRRDYGHLIILGHGSGSSRMETRYAHLSKINVKMGQRVEQGQFIGRVGATGNATGPHLHFEVRDDEEGAYNPLAWFTDSFKGRLASHMRYP